MALLTYFGLERLGESRWVRFLQRRRNVVENWPRTGGQNASAKNDPQISLFWRFGSAFFMGPTREPEGFPDLHQKSPRKVRVRLQTRSRGFCELSGGFSARGCARLQPKRGRPGPALFMGKYVQTRKIAFRAFTISAAESPQALEIYTRAEPCRTSLHLPGRRQTTFPDGCGEVPKSGFGVTDFLTSF